MTKYRVVKTKVPNEPRILTLRGTRVVLDSELARIYGVTTARLNQQVRRNLKRFPQDFAFQLTQEEYVGLMLQNATSKRSRGGRRKLPLVFTEHGAIMAANVLRSERALEMSVFVVRAFIRIRAELSHNRALAQKLRELERKLTGRLDEHERAIIQILEEVKRLAEPPLLPPKRRPIGF